MNRQSLLPLAVAAACVIVGVVAGVATSRVIAARRDRRLAWYITGLVPYGHPDRSAAPLTVQEWAALEGIALASEATAGDVGLAIFDRTEGDES